MKRDLIPAELPSLLRAERELEQALATVRRQIDALAAKGSAQIPMDELPAGTTRH
jgi:hypothetical protein